MGDENPESIQYLNQLVKEAVADSKNGQKVYLHYSPMEHTYKEHIQDLIKDLHRKPGCKLFFNVE